MIRMFFQAVGFATVGGVLLLAVIACLNGDVRALLK